MRSLLFLAALAACSGNKPADVDANPAGPKCAKATYDLCATEHDCMTGICLFFADGGFMVCSQGCDANNPCPNDKTGSPGECTAISACKPAAPNMCHL